MKCFQCKTIDGIEIVFSVRDMVMDPEETKKVVNPIFEETEVNKKFLKLKQEQAIFYQNRLKSLKKKDEKGYREAVENIRRNEAQIKSLHGEIKTVYMNLVKGNSVYSLPRNCIDLNDKLLEKFKNKEDRFLTTDGKLYTVKELNKLIFSKKNEKEKEVFVKALINKAKMDSISLKNSLEVEGDEEALEKAQKHFESLKTQIESEYGQNSGTG